MIIIDKCVFETVCATPRDYFVFKIVKGTIKSALKLKTDFLVLTIKY